MRSSYIVCPFPFTYLGQNAFRQVWRQHRPAGFQQGDQQGLPRGVRQLRQAVDQQGQGGVEIASDRIS